MFTSPFDYLLILAAVVLALAVSDIAISLQRLLAAGRRVRRDWLLPALALLAFLKIVTQWWSWYVVGPIARGVTFEMYLLEIAATVVLFLMSASALPDEIGAEGIERIASSQGSDIASGASNSAPICRQGKAATTKSKSSG